MSRTVSDAEYHRRIGLCFSAIRTAVKPLNLSAGAAENFQGSETSIKTESWADARVIVLMGTGHGPRFPKHVTLTVHGVVWRKLNRNLAISGGGVASSKQSFLPNSISRSWLTDTVAKTVQTLQRICTAENIARLEKEARAKRRQSIKADPSARYSFTSLEVSEKQYVAAS
jgi:hypothetical protein